jgi:hypothetical protein
MLAGAKRLKLVWLLQHCKSSTGSSSIGHAALSAFVQLTLLHDGAGIAPAKRAYAGWCEATHACLAVAALHFVNRQLQHVSFCLSCFCLADAIT